MTEEQFRLEARLHAMEYMIIHLTKTIYAMQGATAEQLDAFDVQALERVRAQTIQGADPAMADIFLDEMGRHVIGMLKDARQTYGR